MVISISRMLHFPNHFPKVCPGSSFKYAQACQSHPCLYTSVPHHLSPSTHPQPGYTNPKNTTTKLNASPLSSAALIVIVYLLHQPLALLLTTLLNAKHTTAQILKFRPVAGGIQLKLPKSTGRLIFRQMDFLLPLLPTSHTMIGAMKPTRNAQIRGR